MAFSFGGSFIFSPRSPTLRVERGDHYFMETMPRSSFITASNLILIKAESF